MQSSTDARPSDSDDWTRLNPKISLACRLLDRACDRTSLLAACVAEAIRLRAPGIAVRMAACDLALPSGPQDATVHVRKVRAVPFVTWA